MPDGPENSGAQPPPRRIRLNLGGEGEIQGVINQQAKWQHFGIVASRTGRTFGFIIRRGHPFLFCDNLRLPFPDNSVDEVLTNSVPVDERFPEVRAWHHEADIADAGRGSLERTRINRLRDWRKKMLELAQASNRTGLLTLPRPMEI